MRRQCLFVQAIHFNEGRKATPAAATGRRCRARCDRPVAFGYTWLAVSLIIMTKEIIKTSSDRKCPIPKRGSQKATRHRPGRAVSRVARTDKMTIRREREREREYRSPLCSPASRQPAGPRCSRTSRTTSTHHRRRDYDYLLRRTDAWLVAHDPNPSALAVTTCRLPNKALDDVSLPVKKTPVHPSIALTCRCR